MKPMQQLTRSRLALTALLALMTCSCGSLPRESQDIDSTPAEASRAARLVAGNSVEGREIPYSVHGSGPLTILLLASIHGDEEAGTPLLERLQRELETGQHPELLEGRRLVILPCANPDGLAADRRQNSNGVDLNRNFPSRNFRSQRTGGRQPLSEPESRALLGLIERYGPTRAMSFHMPANQLDYDGPGEALARHVGAESPLKVERMGSRPGSLGSFFGEDLGNPILTVEQPSSARYQSPEESWDTWFPMIRAAILFEG